MSSPTTTTTSSLPALLSLLHENLYFPTYRTGEHHTILRFHSGPIALETQIWIVCTSSGGLWIHNDIAGTATYFPLSDANYAEETAVANHLIKLEDEMKQGFGFLRKVARRVELLGELEAALDSPLKTAQGQEGNPLFASAIRALADGRSLDATMDFCTPFAMKPLLDQGAMVRFLEQSPQTWTDAEKELRGVTIQRLGDVLKPIPHGITATSTASSWSSSSSSGLSSSSGSNWSSSSSSSSLGWSEASNPSKSDNDVSPLNIALSIVVKGIEYSHVSQDTLDAPYIGETLPLRTSPPRRVQDIYRQALVYDLSQPEHVLAFVQRLIKMQNDDAALNTKHKSEECKQSVRAVVRDPSQSRLQRRKAEARKRRSGLAVELILTGDEEKGEVDDEEEVVWKGRGKVRQEEEEEEDQILEDRRIELERLSMQTDYLAWKASSNNSIAGPSRSDDEFGAKTPEIAEGAFDPPDTDSDTNANPKADKVMAPEPSASPWSFPLPRTPDRNTPLRLDVLHDYYRRNLQQEWYAREEKRRRMEEAAAQLVSLLVSDDVQENRNTFAIECGPSFGFNCADDLEGEL
jgi:hypothetical protein